MAIELVSHISNSFDLFESGLCLLQGKEFKLDLGVNGSISDTVFVYKFTIFVEDCELFEISVTIKVHRHLIETELQGCRGREFSYLLLVYFDLVDRLLIIFLRIEYLLHVQSLPKQCLLTENSLRDLSCRRSASFSVLLLISDIVGYHLDSDLLESDVHFLVDVV